MLQWQAIRVFIARKTYKVAYPQVYAGGNSAEAVTFDCIQRSHQNTLEYAPALTALVVMLVRLCVCCAFCVRLCAVCVRLSAFVCACVRVLLVVVV